MSKNTDKRNIIDHATSDGSTINSGAMFISSDVSHKGVTFAEGLAHTLDFTGTTLDELMFLATSTIVIKLQTIWRTLGTSCRGEHNGTTNVHEFINRPINRTMRPAEDILMDKVDRGEMSQEELAKVIAALQAKLVR